MKTEITKRHTWGFLATEQDVRRLVQTVHEQAAKGGNADQGKLRVSVKLKDGTVIETSNIDDVFTHENAGQKEVAGFHLEHTSLPDVSAYEIRISLTNPKVAEQKWNEPTSVSYSISGSSRDWAFVAASEIEERLRRMKRVSWQAIAGSRILQPISLLVILIAMFGSMSLNFPKFTHHEQLRAMYLAGKLPNATEAIIELERMRNTRDPFDAFLWPMLAMAVGGTLLVYALPMAMSWLSPSYNFVWGGYAERYMKRIRLRNGVFTLVILAIVISVLGNFISKKLGI